MPDKAIITITTKPDDPEALDVEVTLSPEHTAGRELCGVHAAALYMVQCLNRQIERNGDARAANERE